jgi:hypothetical protein
LRESLGKAETLVYYASRAAGGSDFNPRAALSFFNSKFKTQEDCHERKLRRHLDLIARIDLHNNETFSIFKNEEDAEHDRKERPFQFDRNRRARIENRT